jgi:hypothetical protein
LVVYGNRRLTSCTASDAAARSTVEALTFRVATRTLLFDQTWQSNTKAMRLMSSDASAKSPRRAPGAVTSTVAVVPRARLGCCPAPASASRPAAFLHYSGVHDRVRTVNACALPLPGDSRPMPHPWRRQHRTPDG